MPRAARSSIRRVAGFTLIEVVVTLLVLGIAAAALVGVYSNMVSGSADPAIQQQAITVAEAYMEEVMGKEFDDPVLPETGSAEAGETRPSFNDVQDYNALPDNQVRDRNGNPIAQLAAYSVTVSVAGAVLNGVNAMQVDVTVTHPAIDAIALSGFRTDYPPP